MAVKIVIVFGLLLVAFIGWACCAVGGDSDEVFKDEYQWNNGKE